MKCLLTERLYLCIQLFVTKYEWIVKTPTHYSVGIRIRQPRKHLLFLFPERITIYLQMFTPPINDCHISNDSSILWGYYSFGKMGQRESGYQPIVESIWLTPTNPLVSGRLNCFFVSLVVPALYFLDFIETRHVNPCVSAHDDFSS